MIRLQIFLVVRGKSNFALLHGTGFFQLRVCELLYDSRLKEVLVRADCFRPQLSLSASLVNSLSCYFNQQDGKSI